MFLSAIEIIEDKFDRRDSGGFFLIGTEAPRRELIVLQYTVEALISKDR